MFGYTRTQVRPCSMLSRYTRFNGDIRDERYKVLSLHMLYGLLLPIQSRKESNDLDQTEKIHPKEDGNEILNRNGNSLSMKEHVKC